MSINYSLPLTGKTVVVTRSLDQQGEAITLFRNHGAKVLDLPALVIGPPQSWTPLDDALSKLDQFNWLIFSSGNAVNSVQQRLKLIGKSLSLPHKNLKIAAVGKKTAKCLEKLSVQVDYVPPNFIADSLVENFPSSAAGLKILLPRVETGGRKFLAEAFRNLGAVVDEISAYETSCPVTLPQRTSLAFENLEVDAITFTSGKTVIHSAKLLQDYFKSDWLLKLKEVKIISIGPETSHSCLKYFQKVDAEAAPHDLDGLAKACIRACN